MRSQIKAAWDWLPVIVRAIVLGWVLLTIGSTVTFLPLFGNLKFHPEIPWAFPMTLIILALYLAYFSGWGPPATTRDARQKLARVSWPAARIWRAAIPAILSGIVALVALRLLLPSLSRSARLVSTSLHRRRRSSGHYFQSRRWRRSLKRLRFQDMRTLRGRLWHRRRF
jgi:hypothetical protein